MKKILTFLASFIICALTFINVPVVKAVDNTNTNNLYRTQVLQELINFVEYGSSIKHRVNRLAGTKGEAVAATYIAGMLTQYGLEPVNNDSTTNGVQKFSFTSLYTGKKENSYNIIYTLKGKSSDKKVVITTNYDNYHPAYLERLDEPDSYIYDATYEVGDYSDGINASAASVAVILTLANIIEEGTLDYDIDFVFLGAGYCQNSGAQNYSASIPTQERENIILMLDISRIALGSDVYYYSGEFGSIQDEFYDNSFTTLTRYNSDISGCSVESLETPLGYINAGYSGTTAVLSNKGINILHLFAGSYETGIFSGIREHVHSDNILNTVNDKLSYINETYDDECTKNMAITVNAVINMLSSNDFVSEMQKENNSFWYEFFTNELSLTILSIVVLFILVILTLVMHYFIFKNTYKYVYNNEISGVLIKVEEEKDKQDKNKSL